MRHTQSSLDLKLCTVCLPQDTHFRSKGGLSDAMCFFHSNARFWKHPAGRLLRKKPGVGHRFGDAMKVNENSHLGSSAFDPPPPTLLHRDSSFLYEATGSNPSRAINSVHPRQARCLSILRKFRHNIRKERSRSTAADIKLVILEQIHLNKHCLLMTHWIYL